MSKLLILSLLACSPALSATQTVSPPRGAMPLTVDASALPVFGHRIAETDSIDPTVTFYMVMLVDLNPDASVVAVGHTLTVTAPRGETLTLPMMMRPDEVTLSN